MRPVELERSGIKHMRTMLSVASIIAIAVIVLVPFGIKPSGTTAGLN